MVNNYGENMRKAADPLVTAVSEKLAKAADDGAAIMGEAGENFRKAADPVVTAARERLAKAADDGAAPDRGC